MLHGLCSTESEAQSGAGAHGGVPGGRQGPAAPSRHPGAEQQAAGDQGAGGGPITGAPQLNFIYVAHFIHSAASVENVKRSYSNIKQGKDCMK